MIDRYRITVKHLKAFADIQFAKKPEEAVGHE